MIRWKIFIVYLSYKMRLLFKQDRWCYHFFAILLYPFPMKSTIPCFICLIILCIANGVIRKNTDRRTMAPKLALLDLVPLVTHLVTLIALG